jgi:serine/threonine protein kinase
VIRRYNKKIRKLKNSAQVNLEKSNIAKLFPSDQDYGFCEDNLQLQEKLGEGYFGTVYKAIAKGIVKGEEKTVVAVKTANEHAGNEMLKALRSELKVMSSLGQHLNIVNLLGAVTKNTDKILVICEYCEHGNLQEFLYKHRPNFTNLIVDDKFETFDVSTFGNRQKASDYVKMSSMNHCYIDTGNLVAWSFQIARGMDYLALRKVLHGDLAARNILLCKGNVVKICDFGLAKSLYRNYSYKRSGDSLLPYKWLALESIADGVFTVYSDVWSYGN